MSRVAEYVEMIHALAERLVLVLESSYGADVVAVCGAVEVSELGARLALQPG